MNVRKGLCGIASVVCGLLLAVMVANRASAQTECPRWDVATLETRDEHAMAYDSSRGVIVLFGGRSDLSGVRGDTWEWGGTRWERRSMTGPSPRTGHAMAYDAARGVVLLFGGFDTSVNPPQPLGDTWAWNGVEWTRVANWTGQPGTPQPRYDHAMAHDAARDVVVMFGGRTTNSRFGSTWEWNGTAWALRSETGPFPRHQHAMAWHDGLQRVVLFGGNNNTTNLNDLWQWDGTAWNTLANTSAPAARCNHALAYDAARDRLVLIGGGDGGSGPARRADVFEWSAGVWTRRSDADHPDGGVEGHAAAFDAAGATLVMLGGRRTNGAPSGPTFGLDAGPWRVLRATGSIPPPRYGHVMAYDSARGVTVMFAGRSALDNQPLRDLWEWDGTDTWIQRATPDGPPAGEGYAMSYDSDRGVMVLFGSDFAFDVAEHWEWNGEQWTLRKVLVPSARTYPALTYDSVRRRTVMHGGYRPDGTSQSQLWEFDGNAWTLVVQPPTNNPGGLWGAAFSFHPAAGRSYLFYSSLGVRGWNGTDWSQQGSLSVGFPARAAYSPNRGVTYVYPYSGSRVTTWDGQQWTIGSDTTQGPGHINYSAISYDVYRDRLFLFGGRNADSRTWEYSSTFSPTVSSQPQSVPALAGTLTTLSVSPTAGTPPFTYQWRRNGVNVTDDPRINGTQASTLVINQTNANDAGLYTCLVTNSCGSALSGEITLTVSCNHSIETQPQNTAVIHGGTAMLSTLATGVGPFTYQWRKGTEPIVDGGRFSGATQPVLTITQAAVGDAGSYNCVTTGPCATVQTTAATLTVQCDLAVTQHPAGATVFAGQSIEFTTQASGFGGVTYQWRRNLTNVMNSSRISGANSPTLRIDPVVLTDAGAYTCVVTSPCGSVSSVEAVLGTGCFLQFTEFPQGQSAVAGATVVFTAATDSFEPVTLRWFRGQQALVESARLIGTQTSTLTIIGVTPDDAGQYKLRARVSCGEVFSPNATLNISCDAAIVTHPAPAVSTSEGYPFELSVATTGTALDGYQWERNGVPVANSDRIAGVTTTTLTVARADPSDSGVYLCRVTTPCGSVLSNTAAVNVRAGCFGDSNGDGFVNFGDITAVLANFGSTYPSGPPSGGPGDATLDGVVSFFDVTAVLANFGNVCP